MNVVEMHAEPGGRALSSESEVRRSYLVFPAWTQPLWTLLTGKPLQHEGPRWRLRPLPGLLLTVAGLLLLGGAQLLLWHAAAPAWHSLAALLVLPAALVMAGLWRSIQVVYGHHAVHGTLLAASEEANRRLARLLTVVSLSQNEAEYEREHLDHHRRAVFTTLHDADAKLLYRCGLRPGEPVRTLHRRLWMTLLSPRFHAWFLLVRLGSNLRRPPAWRGLALVWMGLVFVAAPLAFGLLPTLLVLWLPLVLVYQMSALLQFSTEHVWLQSPQGPSCMFSYADRCHGRFCGELVPGHGGAPASLRAWARWWLRTLCMHLPARVCVLVGDMPAHDWHHLCSILRHDPGTWPAAIYERQRAIDSGRGAGMEGREIWGLDVMLGHVLASLAQATPFTAAQAQRPAAGQVRLRPSVQEP